VVGRNGHCRERNMVERRMKSESLESRVERGNIQRMKGWTTVEYGSAEGEFGSAG
jgi:hypothetical protein